VLRSELIEASRQRSIIAALPVTRGDRRQVLQQLALRQTIETRTLKRKLAVQRKAIQKTWHPGNWRHFVASGAAPTRFDFYSDESGNAAVSAKKGSCEVQRSGVEIQFGNPNAV
jgi:hypothetical protein